MLKQKSALTKHAIVIGGIVLASNLALAQNWVASGPPGSPVIPFDAIADGFIKPPLPGLHQVPQYSCRGGVAEGYGLQIGRYTPGSTGCEFGYGGQDITVPDIEFLVTSWQAFSGGRIPSNAMQGGWDSPPAGSTVKPPLYYCRATIGKSLQLGKIRPPFPGCVIPYSGREFTIGNYEVLVNLDPAMPLANVEAINGFVPQDAIRAGTDDDGTPLYVCSAFFNDSTQLGKLHPSFKGCNISYGGVEHTISDYFVLRPDWLGIPKFDFPAGTDSDGTPLHVCRAFISGSLYPGKMRSTWTTCSVGLDGKEVAGSPFEVLSH